MKQIVFIFMAILLATGMASAQKKAVISAETTSFDFWYHQGSRRKSIPYV